MLQICRAAPCPPATTILRLHRKDEHLISFSENGYSLNVEFHPKARHRRAMQEMTQKLFECGIRYGSKVHLPKDFSLNRQQFRQLFPNYRQFLELKKKADPEELFQSDMYRRFFRDT
jgi:FAD/FMN-containing dehydrogenase